jgi:ABC-type enterobactin transport system permease subunit
LASACVIAFATGAIRVYAIQVETVGKNHHPFALAAMVAGVGHEIHLRLVAAHFVPRLRISAATASSVLPNTTL